MDRRGAAEGKGYMLATGEAAAARLRLLDQIFGPATRELLAKAGLVEGWHVAEIGCGSGLVALWMAGRVGAKGSVAAVDQSRAQLEVAKRNAQAAGLKNISFHEASADETGLPRDSFDMVYSRFLVCHVKNPVAVLKEMRELLRNGRVLVCEDYDYTSVASKPPTRAYGRLVEIIGNMDAKRGVDSAIGSKLQRLFGEAGFAATEASVKQTSFQSGEGKRFWELTLREAAPAIIEAGAASAEELESVCAELAAIARDETTVVAVARVFQVWSKKD